MPNLAATKVKFSSEHDRRIKLSFWGELRRRNVFKVGATYLVGSWLIVQVISVLSEPLNLPQTLDTVVIVLLAIGFPIALLVSWAYEITSEGLKPTSAVQPSESITHVTGQRLNYVVTVLLALALVVLVLDSYVLTGDFAANVSAPAVGQDRAAEPAGTNSVAVLPFVSLSSDPEQEYFADGLTEELLNALTRIEDLQVAGRTSSFYFKGKNEDLRIIGESLGVAHILEGSVRRSDEEIRITAQLIDTQSGYHLWSETYDRQFNDIFAIQDEIATAVASALEITLGLSEFGRLPGTTRNIAAYNEFLVGSNSQVLSEEDYRAAVRHLEAAVALDPEFAIAWLTLSDLHNTGMFAGFATDGEQRSRLAFERARDLAPDSFFVLRRSHFDAAQEGAWVQADSLIDQAFSAAAEYSMERQVAFDRNRFLLATGRAADALQQLQYLRTIEPLAPDIALFLAESYAINGDYAAALAEFDRGAALDNADVAFFRGGALWAALASGDRAEIDRRLEEGGVEGATLVARTHFDDPQAALVELRRLTDLPGQSGFEQHIIADWAAYFGDQNLAVEAKNKAFDSGPAIGLAFTLWRPIYREMRMTDGFEDLLRKIGLVAYWRETGNWGDFCRPLADDDFECF